MPTLPPSDGIDERRRAYARLGALLRAAAQILDRPDASLDVPVRFMAQTRAVQLAETLKLAKFSVMAHVLVAASFVPFFWRTESRGYVLVFCGAVSALSVTAFCTASLLGPRINSDKAVVRGRWAATAFAGVLGILWATVPIALLPHSDEMHRLIVTNTMTGVIADIFVLGPILTVSVLFVLPVLTGIGIGLSLMGGFTGIVLLVLLGVFAMFVLFSIKEMNKLSVQRIVDRVRVSEQNDTIGLLLRDFEENTSDWLWEIDAEGILHNASERIAQGRRRSGDRAAASVDAGGALEARPERARLRGRAQGLYRDRPAAAVPQHGRRDQDAGSLDLVAPQPASRSMTSPAPSSAIAVSARISPSPAMPRRRSPTWRISTR